jgi:hypothetical protein
MNCEMLGKDYTIRAVALARNADYQGGKLYLRVVAENP